MNVQEFIERLKSSGYAPDIAYQIVNDFLKEQNYTGLNEFLEITKNVG